MSGGVAVLSADGFPGLVLTSRELITEALEDAISWCHELDGTSQEQAMAPRLARYDAALTALRLAQ